MYLNRNTHKTSMYWSVYSNVLTKAYGNLVMYILIQYVLWLCRLFTYMNGKNQLSTKSHLWD